MIRKLEGLEQLCPHFFFPPKYSKHNITTNSTRLQPKSARNFPHQRCFFIVTCNRRLLCPQTASELTKLNSNFSNRQKNTFSLYSLNQKRQTQLSNAAQLKTFQFSSHSITAIFRFHFCVPVLGTFSSAWLTSNLKLSSAGLWWDFLPITWTIWAGRVLPIARSLTTLLNF